MKLPFNLGGKMAKLGMTVKGVSPELCLVGSILLGIGCVASACCATVKSEPAVKTAKAKENDIREQITFEPDPEIEGGQVEVRTLVPVKQLKKEEQQAIREIRVKTAVAVAKNFALPALLGLGSIALNIADHQILRKRLFETTVALAGLTQSFNEYRARVIADQGKEKDQEYLHGLKKTKQVEIDPETGEVIGEKEVYAKSTAGCSQYARWFDEGDWDDANKRWIHQNFVWKDDNWQNQKNLRSLEREFNQKLVADGFLFLNDVYRRLGLPLSIDGQIVGWTYNGNGDHAVSLGVFDDDPNQLPINRDFIAGRRNTCLLEFNVDGPIINELEKFFGWETATKLVAGKY